MSSLSNEIYVGFVNFEKAFDMFVLEALFREGLLYELLYADDLVLMADSMEELMAKLEKWKESLETKGLRVNLSKTKVMRCSDMDRQPQASGKYPCGIYK